MESLVALILDGQGGAKRLDREALHRWTPQDGALWIRIDPSGHEARQWLIEESGLAPGDCATLMRPVRQTRVETVEGGGFLLALRAYAQDTGELRLARWFARADRLITVTTDSFPALDACVTRLGAGQGPSTISDLIVTMMRIALDSDQVTSVTVDRLVTDLEANAERDLSNAFDDLREARQRGAALRQRLGAGREALVQLKQSGPAWLMAPHPDLWRDASAATAELIYSVDGMLERLRALQDYAQNRLSHVLNDRLYLLTILSAIMMPLSFVTGLLGVNVGGIPASNRPWAFAALCALLGVLAVGEYLLLRRLRWVPGTVTVGTDALVKVAQQAALSQAARRSSRR